MLKVGYVSNSSAATYLDECPFFGATSSLPVALAKGRSQSTLPTFVIAVGDWRFVEFTTYT